MITERDDQWGVLTWNPVKVVADADEKRLRKAVRMFGCLLWMFNKEGGGGAEHMGAGPSEMRVRHAINHCLQSIRNEVGRAT